MERLRGVAKSYAWGSPEAIRNFVADYAQNVSNRLPADSPVAELWFGDHRRGPAQTWSGALLGDLISADPVANLGQDVRDRFGDRLPFLLKLIAPARPLSLQVHPNLAQAQAGWAAEEAARIPPHAPSRNYPDRNHKPEMVYALTQFEAMSGFRAPRRAIEVFANLNAPLARQIYRILLDNPGEVGLRKVAEMLLAPVTPQRKEQVQAVIYACQERLDRGTSPSLRADRQAVLLAKTYPEDPGAVLSLLLNPITLQPGQTLFTPAGSVHAYISGLGVELMSASDNVLRAGLTPKHVDAGEALSCMDFHGAPPVRIAPEMVSPYTGVFYVPVDDFELSITSLDSPAEAGVLSATKPADLGRNLAGSSAFSSSGEAGLAPWVVINGRGPRLVLAIAGRLEVKAGRESCWLESGQAVFVGANEGLVHARGAGKLVQAGVP